jgi:20S proteasome subunit beta 1
MNRTELGRLPKVKTVATLMRKMCYGNKDHLMAGMICGGWDPYHGGQVFEIPLGGTLMPQKFAIGGSGSTYIYGLVDATYREGMSKEECKQFVKTGNKHMCIRAPLVRSPLYMLDKIDVIYFEMYVFPRISR